MTTTTSTTHPLTGPVGIGLIGTGGIARAHVRGYLDAPDLARITAVADISEENAQQRATEAGGDVTIYRDYTDLLADDRVDAVDICLPHHLHARAIVAAAQAGKHILCEKPLCLTAAEADEISAAIEASGVTLMCSHNQLYFPAVARARELIDDGFLGAVYELRTTDSFHNDFDPANMGWRADKAKIGGGELIDTGYHPSYLLLHLSGSSPTEVSAMLSKHRLEFMDGEDSAQLLVRFGNGRVGHLVTSWAYQAADCTERFSAVGSEGQLWSDGTTLSYRKRGEDIQVEEFEAVQTIPLAVADFARRLTTGERPIHNQVEGIAVLKMILAAYRSAEENRTVALSEL